jgi:Fe-S oxidoreductase
MEWINMLVTCKMCKSKIDKQTAYKVLIKNKNNYYCNKNEYENMVFENESRFKVIDLSFEIIGTTTNTSLMKELSDIAKVHTYNKILKYMEANIHDLNKFMGKGFDSEYGKIKYFVTIIKNQIGDFNSKKETEIVNNFDIIEDVKYTSSKNKTFSEYIDEY